MSEVGVKEIKKIEHGIHGTLMIPGDKSISHRSVMLSALGDGSVHIKNFLHAQDCMSTVACMEALGAGVEFLSDTELIVTGHGMHGLREPSAVMDAGNSGTTLRLLMGILAPQPFLSTFTGDASLSKRPMERVMKPLSMMGANIVGRESNRKLPITLIPAGKRLQGMVYDMPVASAQVKSAILLAGMYAEGDTTVVEPFASRDHTERMLEGFGVQTEKNGTAVTMHPVKALHSPKEIEIPGDISSAAYWLVAASILPDSDILLKNVGINPTRTGILDVLKDMGADIEILNERMSGGEAAADLHVRSAQLHATSFGAEIMPRLIDEIPILAVAAAFAKGSTFIAGAGELRVKETDRLQAIEDEFNHLIPGCVEASEDSLVIHGGRKAQKARVRTYGDHRMAMSLAVLGMAGEGVVLDSPECIAISYPMFYQILENFGGREK